MDCDETLESSAFWRSLDKRPRPWLPQRPEPAPIPLACSGCSSGLPACLPPIVVRPYERSLGSWPDVLSMQPRFRASHGQAAQSSHSTAPQASFHNDDFVLLEAEDGLCVPEAAAWVVLALHVPIDVRIAIAHRERRHAV